MPNQSPRSQRKRPGDLTGVRTQQLAAQAEKEKAETRAQTAQALEDEKNARLVTEVDYTSQTREKDREDAQAIPSGPADVEVKPRTKRIRVNYPIQDMTFGREVITAPEYHDDGTLKKPPVLGSLRTFNFEEGRWYVVDHDVAEHLAYLGYVYDS